MQSLEHILRASLAAVESKKNQIPPRILRADELPSEAELAWVQQQLEVIVWRPNS